MNAEISRVNRTKEDARRNYNRLSRWYDLFAGSERRFAALNLRQLDIRPGERVLEIGFGTGRSLVSLARAVGESGKVYGIDLSEGMGTVASARLRRLGLSNRAELLRGDATDIPYPDAAFQAILMCFTLELFDTPEIPGLLGECSRVLEPDGRLGVAALSKRRITLPVKLYEWAHRSYPQVFDCRPILAREALERAGFRIDKACEYSLWGLPVDVLQGRKTGDSH
jgi:demethylmenaquinone methyltransferase/2-methoxy-6-polyprenyl-1,4-benzoquinol methylase